MGARPGHAGSVANSPWTPAPAASPGCQSRPAGGAVSGPALRVAQARGAEPQSRFCHAPTELRVARALAGPRCSGSPGSRPAPTRACARELGRPLHCGPGELPAARSALRPRARGEEEQFRLPEYVPEPGPRAARSRPPPRPPGERPRKPSSHRVTGRPDPSVPPSGVSCSGCGAELHCRDPAVPGYLPSEKYRSLMGGQPGGSEAQVALGSSEGLGVQAALGRTGAQGALGGSEGLGVQGVLGGSEGLGVQGTLGSSEAHRALQGVVCQRCWLLVHHQQALHMQVPREQYRSLVSAALRSPPRHGRRPLVLYMVDMLDLPDSVLQDLPQLVGAGSNILVVGNKVDLLPGDSPDYLKRFRKELLRSCARVGILPAAQGTGGQVGRTGSQNLVDVHLISAKTGYGVEKLISKLQRSWKCNGDVYLIGATNSGKSTLFNTLLQSDYCKSKAPEVINRATISPWPDGKLRHRSEVTFPRSPRQPVTELVIVSVQWSFN
nr:nitric oxide-associated protein 1-like [Chelonoidis abingdonii]